jgi:STE24 endopeptidase
VTSTTVAAVDRDRRSRAWIAFALCVVLVGLLAFWWRPRAPVLPVPVNDLDSFDPGLLAAVHADRAPRLVAAWLGLLIAVVVPLLVVLTPVGRHVVDRIGAAADAAVWRAGAVALVVSVATSLVGLPLSAWIRLVHDERFGFRTQSVATWARDWLLVHGGRWLAYAVVAVLLVAAARRWPRTWPYRATVVAGILAAAMVVVHPVLLQPLLLPTTDLPPGEHQRRIQQVLDQAGSELPVVLGEGSRRSTRVNAYAVGIGPTARIVVQDTLLTLPPDHVAAVVAHEIAHHEHRDLPRGVAAVPALVLGGSLLARRVLRWGVGTGSAGAARSAADPRAIAAVLALAACLELVVQPIALANSRQLEAAADARAVELTGDAATQVRMTRVFTVRDLAPPEPGPLTTGLFRSHPGVGDRVRQAVAIAERDGLALPDRATLWAEERAIRHPAADQEAP